MMINTFDSVAGYKINIQKSVLFYIPIMKSQRKNSGKQFHSQYSQKKKNLHMNLTKEVKDLYNENYKILKKEFYEYTSSS
jgi:hypothetical protein